MLNKWKALSKFKSYNPIKIYYDTIRKNIINGVMMVFLN